MGYRENPRSRLHPQPHRQNKRQTHITLRSHTKLLELLIKRRLNRILTPITYWTTINLDSRNRWESMTSSCPTTSSWKKHITPTLKSIYPTTTVHRHTTPSPHGPWPPYTDTTTSPPISYASSSASTPPRWGPFSQHTEQGTHLKKHVALAKVVYLLPSN